MADHRYMDITWRDAWKRDLLTITRGVRRWARALTRKGSHA